MHLSILDGLRRAFFCMKHKDDVLDTSIFTYHFPGVIDMGSTGIALLLYSKVFVPTPESTVLSTLKELHSTSRQLRYSLASCVNAHNFLSFGDNHKNMPFCLISTCKPLSFLNGCSGMIYLALKCIAPISLFPAIFFSST